MSAVVAVRPGVRSWARLVSCEAKMVARDTAGLVVPVAMPLLILVMNAASAGDEVIVHGRTALDLHVMPLILTIVIAMVGVINMPSFLAYYRRSGILRRLSVTPASPAMVLVAQVVVSVVQVAIGIAVALGVAVLGFGARLPVDLGAAAGVLVLAMLAMYALGMVVAALAPTPNSAVAMGLLIFFAIGALGGLFGGTEALPTTLANVGVWLPFGASVDALSATWAGESVDPASLAGLGATTVAGVGISATFFRWD